MIIANCFLFNSWKITYVGIKLQWKWLLRLSAVHTNKKKTWNDDEEAKDGQM